MPSLRIAAPVTKCQKTCKCWETLLPISVMWHIENGTCDKMTFPTSLLPLFAGNERIRKIRSPKCLLRSHFSGKATPSPNESTIFLMHSDRFMQPISHIHSHRMHIACTVSVDWERRIDFEQRLEWWIEDEFYWLNSWHDADTKTHSERTLYIFQIMCDPFCGEIIHQFELQKQSTETDSNCLRIWLNDCSLYSPTRNKFRFEYMIFRFRIRLCVRVIRMNERGWQ